MASAAKGAAGVSKPRSRNESIIEGREANLKSGVDSKREELKALAKKIKEVSLSEEERGGGEGQRGTNVYSQQTIDNYMY
jgi:hypothetical protein